MKRLLYLIPALLLFACAKEPEVKPDPTPDTDPDPVVPEEVVLYADFGESAATKTGFNGATYEWRTGDRIRVALTGGGSLDMRYSGENTSGTAAFTQTETPSSAVLFGDAGFAVYPSLSASNCKARLSSRGRSRDTTDVNISAFIHLYNAESPEC